MDRALVNKETEALLALNSVQGVGFHTLRHFAATHDSFTELFEAVSYEDFRSKLIHSGGKPPLDCPDGWDVYRERLLQIGKSESQRLLNQGVRVFHREDPWFPSVLSELQTPPQWLFVQGDAALLSRPAVAIVGSREPSEDGNFLTHYAVSCLVDSGIVTISGLANGIDQEVHRLSIKYRIPTVAILGTDIDSDYPKGAQNLRRQIVEEGGAVITEYLPGQGYSRENFVQRNRLQAALGFALAPTEWRLKSGTAHTIHFAYELGRPILFLRMPGNRNESEFRYARKELASPVFTVPADHEGIVSFLTSALDAGSAVKSRIKARVKQYDIFGDEQ
jgi:DNA processing protein